MADYHPPIAKAVNGLAKSTAVSRRAIYDLARTAMTAQLRNLTPPLSESDINREQLALEDAINKVEAESRRLSRSVSPPPIRRHDPPPRPTRATGDQQAETGDVSGLPRHATRPRLSKAPPEHPRLVPHALTMEEGAAVPMRSAGRRRNVVAPAIVGLLLLAVAATAEFKGSGIIAALRGTQNVNGTTDSAASKNRDAQPKMADRIESPAFVSPGSQLDPAVAQKVMLYEEDDIDPAGKRFGGTATWHADSVSPGAGQPPKIALRADIEIPDRHIGVRLTLRSNDDAALSSSHTIEIMFTLPPESSHGGISKIPSVMMKQAELAPGVPLAGLGVRVASNIFLISLSSAEGEMQRNVQLLKERSWFDIPIVYDDGHRAIIVIEKGSTGARAFSDAFAAWEQ